MGKSYFALNDFAFVGALVARAAGLDLNECDALLLLFRITADVLPEFRDQSLQ